MKKILGIQKDHNAAACLFYDDELIYYNQEERLSRIKKDSGLPIKTIQEISKIVSEIDVLVISGYDHFESEIFSIISSIQKLGLKLSSQFVYAPYHKSHHLFHAAKAFYSSGFDTALVVVQDGRGSYYNLNNGGLAFETTSVFSVSSDNKFDLIYRRFFTNSTVSDDTKIIWDNNFTQQKIDRPTYLNRQSKLEIRNDFDVGFMYEGTSRSFGFDDEGGKMLGMQSYGKHNDALPQILDENLIFNMKVFNFSRHKKHQGFNRSDYLALADRDACIDFMFMVQKAFEKTGLHLINSMLDQTKKKNLILTGGTALNVVANNFYRRELPDDIDIYIEPLCGDEGNCIGACQHYYYEERKSAKVKKSLPIYICGNTPKYEFSLQENEVEIAGIDAAVVADLIRCGHIIALFQGKGEAGPRALGNRSLLFDPRIENGKDIVNAVKGREAFRPFAAAVMLEHVDEWFNLGKLSQSPFMMYAVDVIQDKSALIPSVVHVDGTCRVQTVTVDQNQNLYNILSAFNKVTGVPVLLNTSFNLAGDPIVETIHDAINSLRRSKIEYLYLPEINKLLYIKN
jgi:carbamoyltransferase